MDRQKIYISARLRLVIALLLVMGCLVAAIGTTYARYRIRHESGLSFQAEQNAMVYLGVEREGTFVCEQNAWYETVDGDMEITFAVSNGRSETLFAQADQSASVRLVATLGAWSEDTAGQLVLTVGDSSFVATAQRIPEGSVLYTEFGDGWVFQFLDENGKERTFPLQGGRLDYTVMHMRLTDTMQDTNLLQLRVVADNQ